MGYEKHFFWSHGSGRQCAVFIQLPVLLYWVHWDITNLIHISCYFTNIVVFQYRYFTVIFDYI